MSLLVFNPSLHHLLPLHLDIYCCFKAMSLVGIIQKKNGLTISNIDCETVRLLLDMVSLLPLVL